MSRFLLLLTIILTSCGAAAGDDSGEGRIGDFAPQAPTMESNSGGDAETSSTQPASTAVTAPPTTDSPRPLVEQAKDCIVASGGELADTNIASVLACFEDIRSQQGALSQGEAEALRSACGLRGGVACTELMLQSDDEEDQLFGLACGGRSPDIPCPEGEAEQAISTTSAPVLEEPQSSPALILDEATRGSVVFYSISEIDRPIYGWQDFTTIAYCANGRFSFVSQGERRTVLDNTEYRSAEGQGIWVPTDLPDGSAVLELQFDDGRRGGFIVQVRSSGFDFGPGVGAQIQGLAGC